MYFLDIIGQFKDDERIIIWDIYNEPGNSGHVSSSLPLLKLSFQWAREANPSQPISSGPWNFGPTFNDLNNLQLSHSDIITFHMYADVPHTNDTIQQMKSHGRPSVCSEYMARPIGSLFETHIPLFYDEDVGCINWGLVAGKTNTIYPWNSPEGAPVPKVWFHDIFYPNGTAFDNKEITVIKEYTSKKEGQEVFIA
jgi:hypothetical protein